MTLETRNYIAGRWQDGAYTEENRNPSDLHDVIGHYAQASTAQLDEAIAAARMAQPIWWAAGLQKRHDVLMAIGTELMSRAAEIGTLLAREEGKTLAEGKGEVYRAGQFFTYYAAEALRLIGDQAQSVRPGIEIDVRREALGVVAIISPWNFPVATPAWKIAPALAFGNAVVWKPANLTPASAVALTEIIARQDIPAGLFNLVAGPGRSLGQHLAEHRGIDAISFTGSVPVGRGIAAAAVANMTKVQMEMGSKNPMLIMDDADLDLAVSHAANAAFGGTACPESGLYRPWASRRGRSADGRHPSEPRHRGLFHGPCRLCRNPQRHADQPRGNVRPDHLRHQGGQLCRGIGHGQ